MAYDQIIPHRGLLSPKGRHSFYWLLIISFLGAVGSIALIAFQYPHLVDTEIEGAEQEFNACISVPYCIPALLFLLLFCISGIAYACFFVVAHSFMSSSPEAFEEHLQAVKLPDAPVPSKHERRKANERKQKKYYSILKRAEAALQKKNLKKAERIYDQIMHDYVFFNYEQKQMLHDDINAFHKKLHAAIDSMHRMQKPKETKQLATLLEKEDEGSVAQKEKEIVDGKKKLDEKLLLKGKSRRFVKCWKLITKAQDLVSKDASKAKAYYQSSWKLYLNLNYHEKKEVYDELKTLYQALSSKNP